MAKRVLRPMSLTGILDEAFDLYKRNFLLFVGIYAVFGVPVAVVSIMAASHMKIWYVGTPISIIQLILTAISTAALILAVSNRYLGRQCSMVGSYRDIQPVLPKLVATYLVCNAWMYVNVTPGAGLLGVVGWLLVIPSIVLMVWSVFVLPVVIFDGQTYIAAIKRSRWLISKNYGRVFVGFFLFGVLMMAMYLLFTFPADILIYGSYKFSRMPTGVFPILARVLPQLIAGPVWPILCTLLYYDIRVRKEGFDIKMLAQSMGAVDDEQSTTKKAGA